MRRAIHRQLRRQHVALGIICSLVWPLPATLNAQAGSVITARMLRRACHALWLDEVTHEMKSLCDIKAVTNDRLKSWFGLTPKQLPNVETVSALANALPETVWDSTRRIRLEKFEPDKGSEFAASSLPGGPGTSALLWGLSDFLVERGKEQLQATVVAQVTSRVCSPAQFQAILANTCSLLAPPGGSSTLPGSSVLRTAVRSDLLDLPGSVVSAAMLRQKAWPDDGIADAAHVVRLTGYFTAALLARKSPLDAFARLAKVNMLVGEVAPFSSETTPAAMHFFVASGVLAAEDRDASVVAAYWPDDPAGLMDLYAIKATVLNAANGYPTPWRRPPAAPPHPAMCAFVWCDALSGLPARLHGIRTGFAEIDKLAAKLGDAKSDDDRLAIRLAMMDAALDLVSRVVADAAASRPTYGRIAVGLDAAADMARDVAAQDYSALTIRAIWLADTLGLGTVLPKNAARTLSFAADIAEAKDAKGVDEALNHFVGHTTYLRKRSPDAGWYLYVNGYAGATYGSEDACSGAKSCGNTAKFAGAYFPVGVELGHPMNVRYVRSVIRSVGLFAQAIDLGVLATWRLENETSDVASAPKVGVEQVFSPGLHLMLGLRGLPLTVGFGRSISPRLREINTATGTEERNAVRRWALSASVDIPLYP
jgi:hypothetical protein